MFQAGAGPSEVREEGRELEEDASNLDKAGRGVVREMFKVGDEVKSITSEMQQIANGNNCTSSVSQN